MDPRYLLIPLVALMMAAASFIYHSPWQKAAQWGAARMHQVSAAVFPSVGLPVSSRLYSLK